MTQYKFNIHYESLINNLEKSKYSFVDLKMKNIINSIIKEIFPILNSKDSKALFYLVSNYIENIASKFGFENNILYYHQFYQNNNQDIKAILNLMLPYIDDVNNNYKTKKIKDLNQLLQPKAEINKNKIENFTQNEYEYSNIAYDLLRKDHNMWRPYSNIYNLIANNYMALLHTLEVVNGKLYLNWINIRPITINSYKKSKLYINTINNFKNGKNMDLI